MRGVDERSCALAEESIEPIMWCEEPPDLVIYQEHGRRQTRVVQIYGSRVALTIAMLYAGGAFPYASGLALRNRNAAIAAPKPLSMLHTTTPAAQLLSIVSNAASPSKLAP